MNYKIKQDYDKAFELAKSQIIDIASYQAAKASHKIQYKCWNCNKIVEAKKSIFVMCIIDSKYGRKFCSNKCQGKYQLRQMNIQCEECGISFKRRKNEVDRNNHHYCSQHCAGIASNRNRKASGAFHSKETIEKIKTISHLMRDNHFQSDIQKGIRNPITLKPIYQNKCIICHNTFNGTRITSKICSKECSRKHSKLIGHKGGSITASLSFHKRNKSKNEMLFYTMIKERYNDALSTPRMFNEYDADIVIPSLKLAIHWNGIWHYKQLFQGDKGKEQYKKIQLRDQMRIDEIQKLGYENYIIKDMGKYNPKFVNEQFNLFLEKYGWPSRI